MLDSSKALLKRQSEMLIQPEEVKQGTSQVNDYILDLGDDNAQNGELPQKGELQIEE